MRDTLARNHAIDTLDRFSLVRVVGGSIAVDRPVQAVTRDRLDETTAKARAEAAVQLVNAALPGDPQNYANWPWIGILLPHMLAVAGTAERLQAGLEATANILNGTARYYHARAAWSEAEPLYQRALGIREKVLGPEHSAVAQSLNDLAALYRDTGRYAEAEPLLRHTLGIREKALGPEHPAVAQSLNNLAALYRDTGQYAEAEPLFERATVITEKTLGPEHSDLAIRLNNLGMLYVETKRSVRAVPLLQRAWVIYEKALGPEHPDFAKVLNNLIGAYRAIGFHGEAKRLQDRMSTIRRRPSADGSRRS